MIDNVITPKVGALLREVGASEILDVEAVGRDRLKQTGSYVLVIRLHDCLPVAWHGDGHVFGSGWYLYAGSARGPGGMAARLRRHFMRDKKIHWHVDYLTTFGEVVVACTFPNGDECDLAQRLAGARCATFGPKGFGSSDCRHCRSHLVVLT